MKRSDAQREEMHRLEAEAGLLKKEASQSTAQAQAIDDSVYDLKAVNPHVAQGEAPATPEALMAEIAAQGERLSAALAKLIAIE